MAIISGSISENTIPGRINDRFLSLSLSFLTPPLSFSLHATSSCRDAVCGKEWSSALCMDSFMCGDTLIFFP